MNPRPWPYEGPALTTELHRPVRGDYIRNDIFKNKKSNLFPLNRFENRFDPATFNGLPAEHVAPVGVAPTAPAYETGEITVSPRRVAEKNKKPHLII